jgi:hypothetical protein
VVQSHVNDELFLMEVVDYCQHFLLEEVDVFVLVEC